MSSQPSSIRAILAAAGANLGIAISKLIAWLLTGSSSMLAESIHSVADTTNQGLLLIGQRRARKAPDATHQFGYGRARYVAAFIVAIMLFTMGGLFALYEAYHKFIDPQPITSWKWVPVVVLIISICLEGFSLSQALKEAHKSKGHHNLLTYVRTSRSPEIPVVLLEDIAALVGLTFALIGVSATLVTGNGRFDAIGSAAIGSLLVVVAVFLGVEMASLLVGESATSDMQRTVEQALKGDHQIDVMSLRTLHLGPEELLVAAKFSVTPDGRADEVAQAIDDAEARIRSAVPITCRIYLEPDIR